jgi:hypothetical protein
LSDLRLVRDGKELPFLIDRPSIWRDLVPAVQPAPDPKRPALSRWAIKLPVSGLPISRIACTADSPLFQREMRLWEEVTDERGDKYPRDLGHATWQRTPQGAAHDFVIILDTQPSGDTVYLETDNGDNPPIVLRDFRCYYPVVRVIFKAPVDVAKPLCLYYGNPNTVAPQYDLSLVGPAFLRAEKSTATAGSEEPTGTAETSNDNKQFTGHGTIIFWGALGVVVVALLLVMAKLLPKEITKPE